MHLVWLFGCFEKHVAQKQACWFGWPLLLIWNKYVEDIEYKLYVCVQMSPLGDRVLIKPKEKEEVSDGCKQRLIYCDSIGS